MRITLNLMPAAILVRREARRRRRALVGIPLVIVAAILLPYGVLVNQISSARQRVQGIEQQLVPLRPLSVQLTQLQQETAEFQRRDQEIRSLLQSTARRGPLLEGISRIVPQDMWLQLLALQEGRLSLRGSALQRLSVARFIQDLPRIGASDIQVQFLRREQVGATDVTSFQLTARMRGSNP